MGRYRYFLAIQTRLPEDYLEDAEFRRNLETLKRLGFDGVELNIRDPETVDPARLKAYLAEFGLVLSMFASGLTARTFQLSLATEDEARRKDAIRRTVRFLEFAHEFGGGMIAGLLKGSPQEAGPGARERLAASVLELAPAAVRLKTPLLIEAVNRYESPVGHSLADTWDIARRAGSPLVQILPDTFHMNIEEANMERALRAHLACFTSLHLSDNTRHFPGFGAIDFARVIAILDGLGYQGKLAIEGNVRTSFAADVELAMQHLGPLLAR
ncbi:MAG TPA: sugar phosphate isomerase/epimerase family protein [Candidatus Methylomirabilis sp.]|nr:sugar phosphate isomerase/epimerase family protein [Candidatus Methylomirabilis sp.]HSC69869.1 sugar phosphate isomerase/epimerase family protein [Candidatus Methylomirabilis sp.]